MKIDGVEIRDAAAEAFGMWAARLVVTAADERWVRAACSAVTGFATSIIGCGVEAGVERELSPPETPDGRPGASVLLFTVERETLEDRLVERIGQGILTCPTAACWDGLPDAVERTDAGRRVSLFGDGHQERGDADGREVWRVPVTEGTFTVEHAFGLETAVGGGAFLILARDRGAALDAADAAVEAVRGRAGVILPFPDGVSRAASKVSSRRYPYLPASTNERFCPTLREDGETRIPDEVDSVLEVVVDGLDEEAVRDAMADAIRAACRPGVVAVDAASFGGRLGDLRLPLREILAGRDTGRP